NLARDPGDAFLVNGSALPHVVLRLRQWSDAPEIARLFLAAFGSEATDDGESLAARQQLVEWLTATGQAQMAAVVRRYFTFPLEVHADALDVVNIWRQLLVKGQKEQIDRFMDEVGKRFESLGWSRQADAEALLNRHPHQISQL